MGLKTAGTRLYYIDPTDGTLQSILCVTSISGLDTSLDQIDVTCLEDENRRFQAGLGNPSAFTFGIQYEPSDPSHVRLMGLYNSKASTDWLIAYPDGPGVPTLDSAGAFDLPTTRSFTLIEGYVSSFPVEFAVNDVVRSEVSVQVSGPIVTVPKTTP